MAVFLIDANIVVYAAGSNLYTEGSARAMNADGARCSAVVLEEVWHLELTGRVQGLEGAIDRAHRILAPLLPVTDDAFRIAREVHDHRLSAIDRLHAGTCLAHGIDTIVTADAAFDGVPGLKRVDPLDAAALDRLLS